MLQRYSHYTHYADWISNPQPGGYWDRISPQAALAGRTGDVAMLHIGGWYDQMLGGTLAGYAAMASSAAPQRLIVGPWGHIPWGRRVGSVDFGPEASSPIDGEQIRWFDRFLKDRDDPQPPVRLFDLGGKAWRDFPGWPEPSAQTWHLSSNGLATARTEDGVLSREPPTYDAASTCWCTIRAAGAVTGRSRRPTARPPGPQRARRPHRCRQLHLGTTRRAAQARRPRSAEIALEADAKSHDHSLCYRK